ncbi:TolC family protein [Sphaerotilus sp.]|uniref:TolC family protein n=1 Tax=Sphaerotilus sp. TaxID=2093942 RepID=UPI00286E1B42|nr:TolC family protein [Sphaerotilus sp.]
MSGEFGWRAGLCAWLVACPGWAVANSALADRLDNPLAVPRLVEPAPEPASPCAALQTPDGPLSLAQAMQTALCLNPQARAAGAAIRVQASAVGEARAAYLPKLNIGVNRLFSRTAYTDGDLPDDDRVGTNRSVNLTWRLVDFGARSASLDVAHQLLRAATASRDATLQKLLAAVVETYFDAVTTQATHGARAEAVRLARSTLVATERREALGVAAGSDVLQARAALARAQLAAQRARGEQVKAASVLAYVMGLPGTAPLTLPDGLDVPDAPAVEDLAHWLAQAQAGHPGIRAAQAQREAAVAKVSATRVEGWPSLDFSRADQVNGLPSQGFGATRSRVTTYGLALSIPLFEGFARVYKVSGAQAQAEQSDASLQNVVLQVSMEVVKAHADATAALDNLQASVTLVDAAQAAVGSATRRYDKGVSDILELLTSQNTLADAQQERIRCLAEWHAARLKLAAAAGVLGAQD